MLSLIVFNPCKAEKPLQAMEIKEEENEKRKAYRKAD